MPVFYKETFIEPEDTRRLPQKNPGHQQTFQNQQFNKSNTFPTNVGSKTTTTTTNDFPANFPKIPPPKGVIDDKQLEKMAEQLMKGQHPTWDKQQYSPPGWTRHSQQSYTIETVVEHHPEAKPIFVEKHYESTPSKTAGIPPQQYQQISHPQQQFSSPQRQPLKTSPQQPQSMYSSSQIYGGHPTKQSEKNYYQNLQQPRQQEPRQQQEQFVPSQQQKQQSTRTSYNIIEERKPKIGTYTKESVVDSTNFPSQQQHYNKTITEYRQQTNGYDFKDLPKQQEPSPQQQQWNQAQQSPQKWVQTHQWNETQYKPQQPQQQFQQTQQWLQTQKQQQQVPQQSQQQQQFQQVHPEKHLGQQQWQTQQYSPQPPQQHWQSQKQLPTKENEIKQPQSSETEANINKQLSPNLSGITTKHQQIEQDLNEEITIDEPPPELQLAQADPDKIIEKQNEWQQEESYDQRPYRSHHLNQRQLQQTRNNYDEPLYISADDEGGYQQHQQYHSPNSTIYWDSIYNDEWNLKGLNPPSFTTGPSWGDHLAYAQRMNLEKRRAESEKQKRHHTPVPGSAEYGYLFGGMDFVDHNNFDPSAYVGEPFNEMEERHSRRDLHWGPPRRRGDFFGLDYKTMLPEEEQRRSHSADNNDFGYYQGYQALPPRKNFRLCGHFTADYNAPLNIAEAQDLDQFDSQYWIGDTLSNQKVKFEYPLTEEEKRTFALLYGPGGFKPDHKTVIPEPKPEEPVQFSVTIGPKKEKKQQPAEGYVNPMKVEGESWMLGQRDEYDGQYGRPLLLNSTADQHLPFHRPKQFPARVPNWAIERMNQMGRGARSLDRSLFLPSWAKVPQPQPPFWVKRDGSKVAGDWNNVQPQKQRQQQQNIQKSEEEKNISQTKTIISPIQQQQQQVQVHQQQISPSQPSVEQSSPKLNSPQQNLNKTATQIGSWGQPIIQKQVIQKQQQPLQKDDQTDNNNQQKTKQQIFSQSQQKSPNQQQQTSNLNKNLIQQVQAVQQKPNNQYNQQQTLHQSFTSAAAPPTNESNNYHQLIITPSKTHQTTFHPSKQPLTLNQEKQLQSKQQQQYYQFYEGNQGGQQQYHSVPQQQQFKQFTSPGGQFYGEQKIEENNKKNLPQQQTVLTGQYYGRIIPSQQQQFQQVQSKQGIQQQKRINEEVNEDESGLENLAKLKLGKFPLRESLEAQQSIDSNASIDLNNNKKPIQQQQFIRGHPVGIQGQQQQQVTHEQWRIMSGGQQPQKEPNNL